MPRVPVQTEPREKARPIGTPYSNVPQTPELFGADIARGLDAGARALGQLHVEEKKEADNDASMAAETQFTQAADQILLDPTVDETTKMPKGYLARNGQAAIGSLDLARAQLRKTHEEIAAGLTSADQRRLFLARTDTQVRAADRRMLEHVNAQIDAVQELNFKARWAASIDSIGNAYNRPADQAIQFEQMAGVMKLKLQRAGLPEDGDEAKALFAQFEDEATRKALDGFLAANDWQGAESLLNARGSLIDATARRSYSQAIEPLKNTVQGELEARKIITSSTDRGGRFDFVKADEQLQKIPPGPIYDEARRRVEHRNTVQNARDDEELAGLYNTAYEILNRTGTLTPGPETPNARPDDPGRMANLKATIFRKDARVWEHLEENEDRLRRHLSDPVLETPAELQVYFDLTQKAASDPESFTDVKVARDYSTILSTRHLEHLNAIQANIREEQTKGSRDYNLLLDSRIVNYYAEQAGIIPQNIPGKTEKWSEPQTVRYGQLMAYVKAQTDEIRAAGKKPNHEDVEKITRTALKRVLLQTTGFFGAGQKEVYSFEIQPGQHVHQIIPPEYRRQIIAGFQEEKVQPNEEMIQAAWQLEIARGTVQGEAPPTLPPPTPAPNTLSQPAGTPGTPFGGKE